MPEIDSYCTAIHDMTLVKIVVERHFGLGDGTGMVGAAVLSDGGHVIDPTVGAEHQHRPLVTPC